MGICQSTALKITVFNLEGNKEVYNFTMKQMKAFPNLGEVFNYIGVKLNSTDRIYFNSHMGLEEVTRTSQFQIRDLIIKNSKVIKYRIVMDPSY